MPPGESLLLWARQISRGQGSDPTEPRPGREEAQARPSACWRSREGSGNFYSCFSLCKPISGGSTTALNLGCFFSRNHKGRES